MRPPSPSARSKPLWSKWPLFAAYWAVQLPLSFFLFPLLVDGSFRVCAERDYQQIFVSIALCVMIAQAAFLLPVRPPRPGPERLWSPAARCALAGAACGIMAAAVFYVLLFTAD